jgi:hypothetical protein
VRLILLDDDGARLGEWEAGDDDEGGHTAAPSNEVLAAVCVALRQGRVKQALEEKLKQVGYF